MRRTPWNEGWRVRSKPATWVEEMRGGALGWTDVRLPHDAMIGQRRSPENPPDVGYFEGGTWQYEKDFSLDDSEREQRMIVEFEGVYRSARVYVNGALVVERPYGYSNFYADLDPFLRYGEPNTLRVEATAGHDSRWYSGAGIYRNVSLLRSGPLHVAVDGLRVSTPDVEPEATVVVVGTDVDNDGRLPRSMQLTAEVVDPSGEVVASDTAPLTAHAGRSSVRQRLLVRSPLLWDVDDPQLYTCRVVVRSGDVEADTDSATFGIRSVSVDAARGLRINGRTVKLRGACIHHDNGVLGSATLARAEERRVERLKAAGFNALRSAHHPMSKATLDACDRLGMLVMDETFDTWTSSKVREDYARWFPEWWRRDTEAMVAKDRNHPSVIMYSIGNEIPELAEPAGAAQSRALANLVRTLDPSRLVTNGVNPLLAVGLQAITPAVDPAGAEGVDTSEGGDGPEAAEVDINAMMTAFEEHLPVLLEQEVVDTALAESCAAIDVVGYNYAESRYRIDHDLHPHRVIVGSETNPTKIDRLWRLVLDMDHVIGDFTWTGWDYLGEAGIGRIGYDSEGDGGSSFLGAYPYLTSSTGDIDITGFRRPVSYLRQIVFGLRSEPYIAVEPPEHYGKRAVFKTPWSTTGVASWGWEGHEGHPLTVTVYSDADEVALLLNGDEIGRAPTGEAHRYRADFDCVFRPGELAAVAYRDGREDGRTALRTPAGPLRISARPERAEIGTGDGEAAFFEIALVDAAGTVAHRPTPELRLSIDGPGQLAGFGSAAPFTEESFLDSLHRPYNGRALAVVRPTGPGSITITVGADGFDPRSATVIAS